MNTTAENGLRIIVSAALALAATLVIATSVGALASTAISGEQVNTQLLAA